MVLSGWVVRYGSIKPSPGKIAAGVAEAPLVIAEGVAVVLLGTTNTSLTNVSQALN
jgi:hypothetical protein